MIEYDVFPEGRRCAVTFSFDDGEYDEQVIEMLDKYNLKATFFLNSHVMMERGLYEKIGEIYKNHEVGCHGCTHRQLKYIPRKAFIEEIYEDRRNLEAVVGYPVTGMSYAYGWANEEVAEFLRNLGMEYSRGTGEGYNRAPEDFMLWNPSCHYSRGQEEADKVMSALGGSFPHPKLLYIWAHGYEFERKNEWGVFEKICETVSNDDRVWYATNGEIYRYVTAQRKLVISADNSMVYNPSATKVWFSKDKVVYSVDCGETVYIK